MNILMDAVHGGFDAFGDPGWPSTRLISAWYYLGLLIAAIGSDWTEGKTRPLRFNPRSACHLCALGLPASSSPLFHLSCRSFFPK